MNTLLQDLRYGFRKLRLSPGFAFVAVLTLAIGIGANTAIFSVVNTVLLARMPYRNVDRLVTIWGNNPHRIGDGRMPVSPAVFAVWKQQTHLFESIAAASDDLDTITGDGEPEMVIGYDFSADFFHVLGATPELGRTFLPQEDQPGSANVAVLSDKIWRRRWHADPSIIGKSINLGHTPYTVVGVMPPTFRYPDKVEIWTPLALRPSAMTDWKRNSLRVMARLAPGASVRQAQTELDVIAQRIAKEHPDTNRDQGVLVQPLRQTIAGDIRLPLLVLLGAVGLVLLIACANVASLLLARSAARERELAVRAALGAGRLRLTRQMFTESVLLSLLGGTAGLLLAFSARRFLLSLFPNNIANLSIPTVEHIPIDWAVIAFTLAGTLMTAVIFGFVPLLRSGSRDLGQVLQRATRGSTEGYGGKRFQSLLVVTEIALSFTLMIGAALLIKSFVQLTQSSLGFQPTGVLALEAFPSPAQYPAKDPKKLEAFIDQSIANLRTIPGVQSAAAVNFLPLTGFWGQAKFTVEGQPLPSAGAEPTADEEVVSPDYFSTMQIPLLRGRAFTAGDNGNSQRVVVVSESLSRRLFGTDDATGKRLNLGSVEKPEVSQIVGVVGDIHAFGIAEKAHDDIYRPFAQNWFPVVAFTVRTQEAPELIIPQAKAAIWKLDPQQPFYKIISVDELAAESIALRRSSMLLLGGFSVIALVLAIVGIYGVLSYSVTQRTREIGIRMAVGANSGEVLRLIFRDGLRLILPGLAAGLVISLLLTRLLSSLLVGVAPNDLVTFASTTALVGVSALAACYVPARRAVAVDPMNALRAE